MLVFTVVIVNARLNAKYTPTEWFVLGSPWFTHALHWISTFLQNGRRQLRSPAVAPRPAAPRAAGASPPQELTQTLEAAPPGLVKALTQAP